MIKLLTAFVLAVAGLQGQQNPIAIINVTVVPMDSERVIEHQTVVVQNGRIRAIGPTESTRLPEGIERIDGRGKFLMPGLTDMHVHFVRGALPNAIQIQPQTPGSRPPGIPASASEDHERENRAYALMFLLNGVTTVRNMWGDEVIDAFAHEIDSGRVPGPHIYSTGPVTDGNPPIWASTRVVETAAQAEEAVSSDKHKGYVAIKVYGALSKEAYLAIIAAAKRQELPVVGHVPTRVGLNGAIAARQDSIEHLNSFIAALLTEGSVARNISVAERFRRIDMTKLPAIADALKSANVWTCPTVVVNDPPGGDATWREQASFVPPDVFTRYQKMYPERGSADPNETPEAHAVFVAIVAGLRKGGARLLLGTDTMKRGTLPGFSLHKELDDFVAARMTPYEAIRTGTADAAAFLHQEHEFGTVSVGSRADLLLLNANPLKDVKHTGDITGVMAAGRWFPVEKITAELASLRATYHR